ncbi:hypothetical protein [Rhodococcus qingshengii]|uniref:hypothetical protein n=1 Tax=Rhodococcus qingshengii TaxID=334542 RepID=UPI001C2295B6|nr:hypothetical protein [Rhodococcus qingshengii]QXC46257.1 hypothetical protein KSE96_31420 [Rhodococcus qingshengii]
MLAVDYAQPTVDRAKALCANGVLPGLQGDVTAADALVTQGLKASAQLGDAPLSAFAVHAVGCIALYNGDPWTAIQKSQEAIYAARELGYRFCELGAVVVLGVANRMLGDATQTTRYHEEMLQATENYGELVYRSRSSMYGGWAMWKRRFASKLTPSSASPAGGARRGALDRHP